MRDIKIRLRKTHFIWGNKWEILKFFKFRYAFLSLSEETYERYFNISQNSKKGGKLWDVEFM